MNNLFSDSEKKKIEELIADIESRSDAEVRVVLRSREKVNERSTEVRALAERAFIELGMDGTRNRTGVLVFIHVPRRKFTVLGDTGITGSIPDGNWEPFAEKLSSSFKTGSYFEGLATFLKDIGGILEVNFPVSADDVNELENKLVTD